MKRIAILCNSKAWGGLELNAAKLAATIRKKYSCTLIVSAGSPIENYAKQHGMDYRSWNKPFKYYDPRLLFFIRSILKETHADFLFASTTKDIYSVVFQKIFFKIKTVYVQQMQFGLNKKGPIHQLFYRKLDYWIAPLHWLSEQTISKSPIRQEQIRYIPLAVDLKKFKNAPSRNEARKLLGLPENEFLVGTIGRFDPAKGQTYLIKAFSKIHSQFPNARLLFIGEDTRNSKKSHLEELKTLAREKKIEDKIYFRSFLSDPAPGFKALDVFAMTSYSESFGMVTIEALASGLPVIGTASGGTPEILENGACGLLVPPKDETALSEALKSLISNPEICSELSQRAILRAEEFSIDLYEKRIFDLIEEN